MERHQLTRLNHLFDKAMDNQLRLVEKEELAQLYKCFFYEERETAAETSKPTITWKLRSVS